MVFCLGTSAFAEFDGNFTKSNDKFDIFNKSNKELSPEEIAKWVTQWEDSKGKKYFFQTHFMQVNPNARDKRKHQQKGTVPFRITGDLMQIKEVRGRALRKRETGSVVITIRTEDGKDLLSKKVSLTKFCPS